ncbi:MAG TPA: serine/threonine-protein kinase [Polyangiaceae bacterium]|nr:serine/threonine-protein kinase [Polyangiaceae bacterium]
MEAALPGADPFIGTTVPSERRQGVLYRIERRLGDGGTAIAYYASRFGPEGTSPAVLKIIQPSIIARSGDLAEMVVKKEAVALGRINERVPPCPSVVRLLDTGTLDFPGRGLAIRLPWLALEYVHGGPEGVTLEERVQYSVRETGFAFAPERALVLLEQLTDGLTEIHAAGVIHRDLNPNNVLCCGSGAAEMFKISDFGIARPLGMQATFGSDGVGTPGYVAPEQLGGSDTPVTFTADIFGAGALLFYVLTGEDLFEGGMMAMVAAKSGERRSIAAGRHLPPEIRNDAEVVAGLDRALALATEPDPRKRPETPRAFAASLKSWLTSCPPTRRTHVPAGPNPGVSLPRWVFGMRHPPETRWVLLRLGWDSDGHCLAATTDGLVYFDGTTWNAVPEQSLGGIRPVRFVASAGAGRWLVGGDGGVIAEYTRTGITRLLRADDPSLTLHDASGELSDLAVAIAGKPGSPPLLAAVSGERWLKPLPVPNAAALTDLCRLDDTRWLVVGRSTEGRALAGIYTPLRFELELLTTPATRAFIGCASRPERELAVGVGSEGTLLRLERGRAQTAQLPESADLAAVTVDVLGSAWAGGAGTLWLGPASDGAWLKAWSHPDWRTPFVSIFAEPGLVIAATADGAVLEGRVTAERSSSASSWSAR